MTPRDIVATLRGAHIDLKDPQGHRADPRHSYLDDGDPFRWKSPDGAIRIDFGGNTSAEHPFMDATPPPYTAAINAWTNPATVDPGKGLHTYKYKVTITDAHGPHSVDPQVIIDSGNMMAGGPDDPLRLLDDAGVEAREAAKDVMHNLLADLMVAAPSKADAPKFFPNGIELISVDVEVGTVKVIVKVAGPKAPTG